jgi:predicted SnoaL-like aldol condensation-catalyzing enzyme
MRRIALVIALLLGAALPAHAADPETNKKVVLDFYEKGLNQKDFEAAAKHFGPRYIQHNPGAPDGIEGFKAFIAMRKEKFPNAKSEIKRVFAEGDFVILHVHGVREPGERGVAIVDIFRLENGKIVEHWDVVQPIPEKPANNNGMFEPPALRSSFGGFGCVLEGRLALPGQLDAPGRVRARHDQLAPPCRRRAVVERDAAGDQ